MHYLRKSEVRRGGSTARYLYYETDKVYYTIKKELKLSFSIASKGGGDTDIQLSMAPEDIRTIILAAAEAMAELATTFTEAAHIAVVGALKPTSEASDA